MVRSGRTLGIVDGLSTGTVCFSGGGVQEWRLLLGSSVRSCDVCICVSCLCFLRAGRFGDSVYGSGSIVGRWWPLGLLHFLTEGLYSVCLQLCSVSIFIGVLVGMGGLIHMSCSLVVKYGSPGLSTVLVRMNSSVGGRGGLSSMRLGHLVKPAMRKQRFLVYTFRSSIGLALVEQHVRGSSLIRCHAF